MTVDSGTSSITFPSWAYNRTKQYLNKNYKLAGDMYSCDTFTPKVIFTIDGKQYELDAPELVETH